MESALRRAPARHTFERILRLTRTGIADGEFLGGLSRLLREVVPFDASFWTGADPVTMLATSPSRLENLGSGEYCDLYWENEFFVEDVNHFHTLAGLPTPAASLCRVTGGRPARSSRYRTVNIVQGLGDELRCVFRTGGDVWGYMCLWRAADARPFDLGEEHLIASLSAPIGEAFRRSALLRPNPVIGVPHGPGLLMFDPTGALESLNEPAEAWLQRLPFTRLSHDDPGATPIPAELRSVVNKARAIAAGRDTGAARARLQVGGRWVVIHGFVLREAGSEGGRTALVIESANAAEMAPLIVRAYQLGRREQQVIHLIAAGLTTSEIAVRLCLSTHTVRGYLKQIFEKVKVSTRGELTAKIFADHYKETMHPDFALDL
ncbi:LuxR C-terminal-related transcriptional regulator [Streptosporangium sp. NPDC000095]|uniref:helix-turn-helix transcriptional regulator n=1 Tax=Streptosporangium sp. NPDC000095 TaxID=3366184 RepID=UPI003676EF49